jgi:hypothetical protein
MKNVKIKKVQFVSASAVVSKDFLDQLGEGPFTWGDAPHTLVYPQSLIEWAEDQDEGEYDDDVSSLVDLPDNVMIDLET